MAYTLPVPGVSRHCPHTWVKLFGLLIASSFVHAACGATIRTLTFDEVPFQSVDDLTFAGVTFDFKIGGSDSNEAFYNSFGPGTLTYVDDPSLTGSSDGVLTLSFSVPTSILEFGVALSSFDSLSPGARVELFDAQSSSLGVMSVNVSTLSGALGFAENRFQYVGTPVSKAILGFELPAASFALDNLTYDVVVPEPPAVVLAIFAASGIVFRSRRR
jgi:hypothetical protein